MYSKILISVAALLCLSSLCLAVDWSDCGSEDGSDSGSLINVVVKDCDEKRCSLVRGQNATFEITFKSKIATKSVNATVFLNTFVLKNKLKFDLPNPLACEEAGLTCPLAPESTYTYKKSVFVKPTSLRMRFDMYGELLAEDGSRLFCAIIPIRIVPKIL